MANPELVKNWAKKNGYHVKEYHEGETGSYTNLCIYCGTKFIGFKNDLWCGKDECEKNKEK